MLSDGDYRGEAGGRTFAGRTALLQAGNATLVVTSRPVSLHEQTTTLT